jgi:hypothetical protein
MPFPSDPTTTATIRQMLARKGIAYDEASLIGVLDNPRSGRMQVYWAVAALGDVGTQKCIPALKRMLHYPMRDVKDCSIVTIAHIAGAAETQFYIDALRDKRTQKSYPMWAIYDAADERAVPAVIEYLLRDRKRFDPNGTAVQTYTCGITYLAKFQRNDPRIEELVTDFKKRWAELASRERTTLLQMIPWNVELARVLGDEASMAAATFTRPRMSPNT